MKKNQPQNFCHHVKANGALCEALPVRNQDYCYFHLLTRDRLRRQRQAARESRPLQIGILEDQEAIQLALGDLANAVLAGRVDATKAHIVLAALQTAAKNYDVAMFTLSRSDSHFLDFQLPDEDDDPVTELNTTSASAP
jgi:hypothetical protein